MVATISWPKRMSTPPRSRNSTQQLQPHWLINVTTTTTTTILLLLGFTYSIHLAALLLLGRSRENCVHGFTTITTNDFHLIVRQQHKEPQHHLRWIQQMSRTSPKVVEDQERRSTCTNDDTDLTKASDSAMNNCTDTAYLWNRRRLSTIVAPIGWIGITSTMTDASTIHPAVSSSVLNCLQDLPVYNRTTTVRLFLCRHGETDYNRNNVIQGARIDPPINTIGVQQATVLGQTLARAGVGTSTTPSGTVMIVHSPLQRSQQTAQIVADQMCIARQQQQDVSIEVSSSFTTTAAEPAFTLQSMETLAEVDFGSVAEGAPVMQYRNELITLYTSWALGNYSARMTAGGESGIEVRVTVILQLRFVCYEMLSHLFSFP
jgi:broad specificity phosphatase PhoE